MAARILLSIAVSLLLTAPGLASAALPAPLPPGVHVDPNSPAGKEYAVPLGQARGGGSGGGDVRGAQLFGSGITRRDARRSSVGGPPAAISTRSRASAGSGGGRRPASRARRVDAQATSAAGDARLPRQQLESAQPRAGGAGIEWMLGAAAFVLLVGGLGGGVIARGERRTSARLG